MLKTIKETAEYWRLLSVLYSGTILYFIYRYNVQRLLRVNGQSQNSEKYNIRTIQSRS